MITAAVTMFLLGAASASMQTLDAKSACNEARLPDPICSELDATYGDWRLAKPDSDVIDAASQYHPASPRALMVVEGDFDGNTETDYAMHLLTGNGESARYRLVAFLSQGGKFTSVLLNEGAPSGQVYIWLAAKGTKDHDYTHDKDVVYAYDSIELNIFEKGGSTFVYEDGKFVRFISSD